MRTCTIMTFTDGKASRYCVMRGPMSGKAFNAGAADIVATVTLQKPADDQFYLDTTARYATPEAPPVYWQRS